MSDDFLFPKDKIEKLEKKIDYIVDPAIYKDEDPVDVGEPIVGGVQTRVDDVDHPFYKLRSLTLQLERVITQSNFNMDDEKKGSDWAKVQVAALREIRMLMQSLIPKWEEFQQKQMNEEEAWVDYLMDFNLGFIAEHLGDELVEVYMEKWEAWRTLKPWRDAVA